MPQANTTKIDFCFTDVLAELDYIRKMDGLAAGTFVSMWGDEVTFSREELPDYVRNTQRVLNSTKDSQGNVVGLPIDQDAHDHAGGAGWIIGLSIDETRDVIVFDVNWTDVGLDLIRKNIRRFFSPSVDIVNKVILGGSLTNYPASRNEKGQIMLRPIELSQTIKELNMPDLIEQIKQAFTDAVASLKPAPAQPPAQAPAAELSNIPNPELLKLYNDPHTIEELETAVATRVKDMVNVEIRKKEVKDFVSKIVGGTKEKPYGLAINPKETISWLLSLNDAQYKYAVKILGETQNRAIDFAEHGITDDGFVKRPKLPEMIAKYAREFCAVDGNTIEGFFKVNPEVGKAEDYDLAEFAKSKE